MGRGTRTAASRKPRSRPRRKAGGDVSVKAKSQSSKPLRKRPDGAAKGVPKAGKKSAAKPARKAASRKATVRPSKASPAAKIAALDLVLAAFAHEVRTPLTGILALSELLITSDLGEREKKWAETIKSSAEHLSALSTLFVDAAKSRANGLLLREDIFEIGAFAHMLGAALKGRAEARGLQARINIVNAVHGDVVGDKVRLRASLENLIDNAVKFTEAGEVALKVGVSARDAKSIALTFEIADQGKGLSADEIARLFKPFVQIPQSDSARRVAGAGLGLAAVRANIEAMGGDVGVTRNKNKGATFTVRVALPRAPASAKAAAGEGRMTPAWRAMRILCIEDNPYGRVVLNTILTELGHQPVFVSTGEDALRQIAGGAFDAVLMDVVLPGIDGLETTRRIRALASSVRTIPIIGLSGRAEDVRAALGAGMNAFLTKPVNPRAIANMLNVMGEAAKA